MPSPPTRPVAPRWYFIPVRVLLVTFLLTLLAFAISLGLGILGTMIVGLGRGIHPNLTVAYRHVALPAAVAVAAIALVAMVVLEVRNYRQTRALSQIAGSSR